MAVIKLLPGGLSGGFAPPPSSSKPAKRGKVQGWSKGSARRNLQFLWSIDTQSLTGTGFAVTLTTGVTPASSDDWEQARRAWFARLRRRGMHRYHWVTEWTRIGRPHLHAAVYTTDSAAIANILLAWLEVADSSGWPVSPSAQHIVPISGVDGWLQYVSKHASRGVTHYQHLGKPEGWSTTGKLWGKGGDWPSESVQELELGVEQFLYFRRRVWDWMLQDMVDRGVDEDFILKTAERWENPEHGNHHGISGWIPAQVAYGFFVEAKEFVPADFVWER